MAKLPTDNDALTAVPPNGGSSVSRRQFIALGAATGTLSLLTGVPAKALDADIAPQALVSPPPPANGYLSAGGVVADFAQADPTRMEATYANASGRNAGLGPDEGAYASYQSALNSPTQYCGCRFSHANGRWNFGAGDTIAVELGFSSQANGDDFHNHTYINVFLVTESDGFTNYFRSPVIAASMIKQNREVVVIRKSEFAIIGAPDWSSIARIEVRLNRSISFPGGPNAFNVYRVWACSGRPTLVFCFDDARSSALANAILPWFSSGWRCSVGVNSAFVGGPGYMSLSELKYLHDILGHDTFNHTARHDPLCYSLGCAISGTTATYSTGGLPHRLTPGRSAPIRGFGDPLLNGSKLVVATPTPNTFTVNLAATPALTTGTGMGTMPNPALTSAQVDSTVVECTDWLLANNLTRGARLFAYPYGYYDYAAIARLKRLGMRSARTVRPGLLVGTVQTDGVAAYAPQHLDLFSLSALSLSMTNSRANTAAKVLAVVDTAIARGLSLFIYAHEIVPAAQTGNDFNLLEFNALMAGVKQRVDAGQCDVRSYQQWFDGLGI